MARTTLAKTQAPGGYASTGASLILTAADLVNKNQFVASGNDLVVAQNTDAAEQTMTITSAVDPYGRTKDVAAYAIPAGGVAVLGPFPVVGWQQPDGKVYLEASSASVKFGVVSLT